MNALTKKQEAALIAIRDCKTTFTPVNSTQVYVNHEAAGVSNQMATILANKFLVILKHGRSGAILGVQLTTTGAKLVEGK